MASETQQDPERIYLEPAPGSPEGRMWCEDDDVWQINEGLTGVEYIRADLHAAEIARLTAELDVAWERERGYREALEHIAADRWTMDVRCIGMMRDAARRALASTPPDTEGQP